MHIVERLIDLHKQATTEKSHFYVAETCELAIAEIKRLGKENFEMSIILSAYRDQGELRSD